MEKNNHSTQFGGRLNHPDDLAKIAQDKTFKDWVNDTTNPLVYCLLTMDGKDFLIKNSFHTKLSQKTNKLDNFSISVPSDAFDGFEDYVMEKSKYLLGKEITITYYQYGKIQQTFFGIIDQVKDKRNGTGYGNIILKGKSPALLLHSGKKHRSFTNKTLKQIIQKVCEAYTTETKVQVSDFYNTKDKVLPYIVQSKETDYEFIQRLARKYGEYFYYNGEKLIFGNEVQPIIKIGEGIDLETVDMKLKLTPQNFAYQTYNDSTAEKVEQSADSRNRNFFQYKENAMQVVALNQAEKVFTEKPQMHYNLANAGANIESELKDALLREKEKRQNVMKVKGQSRNPALKVGSRAEMSDINDKAMETYRILEIKHFHDGNKYYNTFTAIPDLFQAPYQDNDAISLGEEQPAKVMDNNDPEQRGRIRVQFPWQEADNEMTPWIRFVTLHAGAGKGANFTPEIGEEVLVNFESGNAEKPYVAGTLYNGKEKSGYHTSGNDLKVIKTRSGHTILMNDSEDKMSITILDISGNTLYMDTVKKSITIQAPETIDIVCKNLNIKVEENMKTTVGHNQENTIGKNIKTVAKEEISQDSGKKMILASGDNTEISARKDLDLYGKKNLIGFTDGKTEFGAKGQMHVYGMTSLITAKDKIEYKAPQMNKLPESGKFKYDKEKQIISVKWMDAEMENNIDTVGFEEKLSLLVQTRNYEEGETITIVVDEIDGKDINEGVKELTLTGTVNKDGFAELKEEVEVMQRTQKEKEQEEQQNKDEQERKENEVYKTIDGRDFTFNQWQAYEEKKYEEFCKKTGRPYTPKHTEETNSKPRKFSFLADDDNFKK